MLITALCSIQCCWKLVILEVLVFVLFFWFFFPSLTTVFIVTFFSTTTCRCSLTFCPWLSFWSCIPLAELPDTYCSGSVFSPLPSSVCSTACRRLVQKSGWPLKLVIYEATGSFVKFVFPPLVLIYFNAITHLLFHTSMETRCRLDSSFSYSPHFSVARPTLSWYAQSSHSHLATVTVMVDYCNCL